MKPLILFILSSVFLHGCYNSTKSNSKTETNIVKIQTSQEKEALKALTQLQLNADVKNSIYLTFAYTNHSQLPSDSSFTISQDTFRRVLVDYTKRHHKNIPLEERIDWVQKSVRGKESYKVYYCKDDSKKPLFSDGLPYSGAWILPNVLSKDIVLIWRR